MSAMRSIDAPPGMSGDGAVSEFDSDERVRRHSGQDGAIGGLSDTALAVVVGTLTLVGVVGFFQSGSSGAKTNSEIANLTALVGSIRAAYYQAGSDYSGITSAILASSKIAPAPLIRGANLTSMFGGAITVASATSNSQFTVQYAGIPVDACIKILTNVWVNMSDVIATSVNGAAATTFTMAGATTACGQSSNSILFTFQ